MLLHSNTSVCSWLLCFFFAAMSSNEDASAEVIVMDVISPASSMSMSDSESMSDSQEESTELFKRFQVDEEEEKGAAEEEEGKKPSDITINSNDSGLFMRKVRSSRSASPLEMNEERCSELEYPLSQRVYSNPPCTISIVLQRQSRELWDQFDSIGTEMIVTRRGRLELHIICSGALLISVDMYIYIYIYYC